MRADQQTCVNCMRYKNCASYEGAHMTGIKYETSKIQTYLHVRVP